MVPLHPHRERALKVSLSRRRALGALAGALAASAAAACGDRAALEKDGVAGGYKFTGARPSNSDYISDTERQRLESQYEGVKVVTPPPP